MSRQRYWPVELMGARRVLETGKNYNLLLSEA